MLWRHAVRPGQAIALDYVHSLFRRPVRERFVVTPQGLLLVTVASTTPEIDGYYAFPGARLQHGDGPLTYRLVPVVGTAQGGLTPPVERLPVRATLQGRRTLVVGGACYPLTDIAGPGRRAWIVLRRLPRGLMRLGEVLNAVPGARFHSEGSRGEDESCLIAANLGP